MSVSIAIDLNSYKVKLTTIFCQMIYGMLAILFNDLISYQNFMFIANNSCSQWLVTYLIFIGKEPNQKIDQYFPVISSLRGKGENIL